MLKAVIFDVGGVLLRTENRNGRYALEQRLGLQPGESEHLVFNSEMGTKGQLGQITTAQLWQWLQEHLQLSPAELAAFQHDFWSGDRLDTEMVNFIRHLRPRYQTAVISNAPDNLAEVVTVLYPMADAFDLIVGSAYEKVMKPSPIIFERTLIRLGRLPEEAVFVDDFAHNVAGARAVGLQAIHYQAGMDLPAALGRLGVV